MAPYEMEKQDSYFDYKLRFIYSCISPICRSDNHDNNYHHQEKKKKMMMMKKKKKRGFTRVVNMTGETITLQRRYSEIWEGPQFTLMHGQSILVKCQPNNPCLRLGAFISHSGVYYNTSLIMIGQGAMARIPLITLIFHGPNHISIHEQDSYNSLA